jgi:hypothetical protein
MSEKLLGHVPPQAIAQLWPGTLKFRVMRSFQHALLTLQLITDANGKAPDMRLPSDRYADIEDWVAAQRLPIAEKYAALRAESVPWQEAAIALDDWVRANELCGPGAGCGLDKAMNGTR